MRCVPAGVLAVGAIVLALVVPGNAAKPTPGQKCAVSKLKAAFKKTAAKGACYEKAVTANVAVEPACLMKADEKFSAAFQKAEAKGGCATTGDAATIEGLIDTFVLDVATALPAVPTTSTSTTTSTTLPPCGSAEAPACNGTCQQAEAHCGFSGTPGVCVCAFG